MKIQLFLEKIRKKNSGTFTEDEDTDTDLKLSAPEDRVQNIEEVNRKFNDDLDRQIAGTLPKGKILDAALYHSELIGQSQPNKRPNYLENEKRHSERSSARL